MNLYKYVGASYVQDVLRPGAQVTLKCSYPKGFNDPYELFLSVDATIRPEALAFYADLIGELPQIPTTCFSRSPVVTPMWAHYAESLRGIVIEFCESTLAGCFPEGGFGDVDYRDEPDSDLGEQLHHALLTKKFRHTYLLRRAVFSAAYYTKVTSWSYEQERRMVVGVGGTRVVSETTLIDVPKECVSALICGPRASSVIRRTAETKAVALGCRYYELRVGRSSAIPFLLAEDGTPHVFRDGAIAPAEYACGTCGEPLSSGRSECSWCQITEAHVQEAALSNPFRILQTEGMLEDYIREMNGITERHRDRQADTEG